MTQAIEVKSLTLMRGNRVLLRDLSLSIPAGQCLVLMADNGTGKTTLLQAIAGLSTPVQGEIFTPNISSHEIRYIGHRNGLWPSLTVAECSQYLAALYGCDDSVLLAQSLAYFDLQDCRDLPVAQCSAGQKRRLALSLLVMSPGKVWLLDEPMAALDSAAQAKLWRLIGRHLQAGGYVCMASHQDKTEMAIADVPLKTVRLTK